MWRAELTALGDDLSDLLSPEEHDRAQRLAGAREAPLWARSRGLLRALLGLYLQIDAHSLTFTTGAHGKPALADSSTALSFNLSHSGATVLYAFSSTTAVGVDVELLDRPRSRDVVSLAGRVFGPVESERLARLGQPSREREFLRLWVRHEAELKCMGVGLGGAGSGQSARRPWIVDLKMGSRTAAALAAEEAPRELRIWEWPSETPAQLKGRA